MMIDVESDDTVPTPPPSDVDVDLDKAMKELDAKDSESMIKDINGVTEEKKDN